MRNILLKKAEPLHRAGDNLLKKIICRTGLIRYLKSSFDAFSIFKGVTPKPATFAANTFLCSSLLPFPLNGSPDLLVQI